MDLRSLISQIPMEPGYVPAPPEPDLSVIQRLMGLPQTLRAVGQNLAVGAASLPVGIYRGFGDPAAGEAAMSQFQQEYGYTPTNPAAQRQLQGLGEFLQSLETEYKIPPIMAPVAATPALGIRGLTPQTERLARDLVREIQTTPPTGAVTMAPTPSVPKSDLGFYSQLEAAVQPLQNKGTGQQYLAQIQKSAGVKPEEIQWTGLDTFLQGRQSVTKQEIQDYLNANRVDVQEVRLEASTGQRIPLTNEEQVRLNVLREREQTEGLGGLEAEEYSDLLNKEIAFEEFYDKTRFSDYTLPGGENYREILLTLPSGPRQTKFEVFDPSTQRAIPFETREEAVAFANQDPTRSSVVAEVDVSKPEYRSGHFDQPNILAHLRVNDRTVDGKKTLFVEEIQSDWHQAGRKKGYADRNKPWELFDPVSARVYGRYATAEEAQAAKAALPEDQQYFDIDKSVGVPDAPFKTSWHELSLKRAIQEAAEKGYDQIAFTTGKTQAERYDLSNRIKTIVYSEPDANGRRTVTAITPDGDRILGDRYTMSEIEDNVGKEMAEKMEKSAGEFDARTGTYALSGLDLKTEHKGMKGFYDNILPKSLDKLGKKFGAKVGKTEMDGVEVWQMDITPQMRESVTTKGQPLFAIPAIGAGLLGAGMMQEEEQF